MELGGGPHSLFERVASLNQAAAQASHDMRSPLSVLEMLATSAGELSEDKRLLLQSATRRIRDIADCLFLQLRLQPQPTSCARIRDLLDEVLREKRLHLSTDSREVELIFSSTCSIDDRVLIKPSDLQRLFSNLLDNALRASLEGDSFVVRIDFRSVDSRLRITIHDQGPGIAEDIRPLLGKQPISDHGGQGLGIFHAFTTVRSWGGSLELKSERGRGTTVEIWLPVI